MAYELLSQSTKLNKREGVGWGVRCGGCPNKSVAGSVSLKKKKAGGGGALIRDPRVKLPLLYLFDFKFD